MKEPVDQPQRQKTLAATITFSGVGLHTGGECRVEVSPLDAGAGCCLAMGEGEPFRATTAALRNADRCTTLGHGPDTVSTVEHLFSALAGLGVDNCLVKVDGPEIPALDGSALPFVNALMNAGLEEQAADRLVWTLASPVWVERGGSHVLALPSPEFKVTYGLHFDHPVLGQQVYSTVISPERYRREIAPARTFGFLSEVEELRRRGLAQGGSLENAVIVSEEGYINPLRFDDEPARHKALDLIGDLYLLGRPLQAHVIALKTGHFLNTLLVQRILETRRD